ncbi:hypothetical protein [Bacillus sp. 491mf]|uniref:hypothetical protein n=1 Tax=Bacillus sp. 491mf TaxID=1761755 RepID=UPI000AAF19DA|nr:hypothetical protein [Bacillus sp. 491mf]
MSCGINVLKRSGYFIIVIGSVGSLLWRSPYTTIGIVTLMILCMITIVYNVEKKLKEREKSDPNKQS